jgi:hypothetical protein
MRTIRSGLGVAPSTADRILGLIEGRINPDNVHGVEVWALQGLNLPVQTTKVLNAINQYLDGSGVIEAYSPGREQPLAAYVCRRDAGEPTLLYDYRTKQFLVTTVYDYMLEMTA